MTNGDTNNTPRLKYLHPKIHPISIRGILYNRGGKSEVIRKAYGN